MVLRCDEERVLRNLDDFDEALVGRGAREDKPLLLEALAQMVVDFEAVAVTL